MKTKNIFRAMGMLFFLTAMFLLSSCTKTADGNLTKEQLDDKDRNLEATAVDDKDLAESDSDLTTVDYKEFYDQLTPFGEWVQVKPEEIGMKPETAASIISGNKSISLAGFFGIQDAYASTTENAGMVYVWRPSSSLAVTSVEGVTPVYVPYSNGKWVNTNAGWYFKANTPAEETTSHYGRWVNSPSAGWLWVPGRVWAPAWVDWKQNDKYVSWAPLPPSVYMVNGSMSSPVIDNNNYVVVEKRYFLEPDVYKYNNAYYGNDDKVVVSDLASVLGLVLVDNLLMNRGPEVSVIQTIYGRNIEFVNLQQVRTFSEVRYTDKEYYIYHPGFKRYKNKGNNKNWFTVNEPKSFKKYGDWKESKSDNKEYKKEEKDFRKEVKKSDDGKMYNGGKNNNNGKKNDDGNVKGKYNNGNDNGKNHDGDIKGKKQDGNDNGKKHDGNDNGGKHDDNGNKKGKEIIEYNRSVGYIFNKYIKSQMYKINLKYRISALIVAAFFSIAGLNGCGDTVTTPPQADNLTFSGAGSQDSIGDGTGIFVIDTVKILIKDIKIKVANNNEDSTDFKVGPFVLFLNLSSNVTVISSSIVPVGNYRKVKFEIHKLEDTEAIPDPEFADANGRYSVIVKGSYLGNYFVYKSSKSAHQILQFPNDVPVAAIAGTNLTLVVRPYIWFIKNDVYMDPFDPANMNDIDNNIKDNIKNNFKAFKDDDRNGIPD